VKLFVTGISGRLGLNLALQTRELFQVSGCYHTHPIVLDGIQPLKLDVTSFGALEQALRKIRPDVIVHTAGLTSVEECEANPVLAYCLNVEAAQHVAKIADALGAQLVHISTDHLFDGTRPWRSEVDTPAPLNTYARTKWQAEQVVLQACPGALIIRTNFFGWGTSLRASFSDWILRSLAAGQALNMFTDVFFTPILINDLIEILFELQAQGARGIFNVVGRERVSKYEFGLRVARAYGYPPEQIHPRSVEGFPFRAVRPRDMSLNAAKAAERLGRPLSSVDESLAGLRRLQSQGWPQRLEAAVQAGATMPVLSASSRMNSSNKIAFVVPTRNRPDDLRRMLSSVRAQSVWPDQIVLVDGGDEDLTVAEVARDFSDLNIDYRREYPPSLAKQRNVGIAALRPDISLAGYLDDDLVLEAGALRAMLTFWETAGPEVGGARFNLIDPSYSPATWLKALFLMDSPQGGRVLPSGFISLIPLVTADTRVEWLSGGATIWRRSVVREFDYDNWYSGTGYLEDVDYSYQVGQKYELWVVAVARMQHLTPPMRPDKNFILGKWQIINRVYFVRKNPTLSQAACAWSLFGQVVYNVGRWLVLRDWPAWERVRGNLDGVRQVLRGNLERVGGVMK